MLVLPVLLKDGYKADHRPQYPVGTEVIYSNMTPRKSRVLGVEEVVVFGIQYFVREFLTRQFQENFFDRNRGEVLFEYKRRLDGYLGKDKVNVDHIGDLHDLGYLPLSVKALHEGSLCPTKVPLLTVVNTHPDFFWLTNQLETLFSCELWPLITSATTAYGFRKTFNLFAKDCGIDPGFVKFMGHDFSMRGMFGHQAAMMSGAAHLTSFAGTDTIPAIDWIEEYYGDWLEPDYLIGASVPATEHSVMCAGGADNEIETIRRLITEVYPTGIVSIVSDTWDFWGIMTDGVRMLKDEILARDGKVVFRPDSGDPVQVICGDPDAPVGSPQHKGAMKCLLDVFGGEKNAKGFTQLNPKVGLIYGDGITKDRQDRICYSLFLEKIVPDVVLGMGSYTYQYVTRDTFGFAIKATYSVCKGVGHELYKDPKTDKGGEKKSAKGLLSVDRVGGLYILNDQCTPCQETHGHLREVFVDGRDYTHTNIQKIRTRLHGENF